MKILNLGNSFQEKLLIYFTVVGVISTTFFGILNVSSGNKFLGFAEIFLSFLAVLNLFIYKKTRDFQKASNVILILVFTVLILIILNGGYQHQGIFWIYVFPLLAFFLKDKKTAFFWNLLFIFALFLLTLLSIFGVLNVPYKPVTIFEAFMAYMAVSFLAYLYSTAYSYLLKKLNYMAVYDSLTGLYNRYFVVNFLKKEIEKIKRNKEKNLCIAYIDLDNFKYVNDNLGHIEGDRVLKEVAKELLSSFRKTDVIGRIGGDEFLIVAPICKKTVLELKLEKIRRKIEEKFKEYRISFSYGIVVIPDEALTLEKAIKLADEKMYSEKTKKKAPKGALHKRFIKEEQV